MSLKVLGSTHLLLADFSLISMSYCCQLHLYAEFLNQILQGLFSIVVLLKLHSEWLHSPDFISDKKFISTPNSLLLIWSRIFTIEINYFSVILWLYMSYFKKKKTINLVFIFLLVTVWNCLSGASIFEYRHNHHVWKIQKLSSETICLNTLKSNYW